MEGGAIATERGTGKEMKERAHAFAKGVGSTPCV